jgi:hypothetical protein
MSTIDYLRISNAGYESILFYEWEGTVVIFDRFGYDLDFVKNLSLYFKILVH